jgi:4-hydroxybenzoyl-CoA thioesterase
MFKVSQRIRIEWAHCDPARIIFNPHYYIWMDSGTHILLQTAGFDFIAETRSNSDFLGCPLVASNMEFKRPVTFGDVVVLSSQVQKFGNTSFVVAHSFSMADDAQPVAAGSEVRVWACTDPAQPGKLIARPVPAHIREMLSVDASVAVAP